MVQGYYRHSSRKAIQWEAFMRRGLACVLMSLGSGAVHEPMPKLDDIAKFQGGENNP